MSHENMWLRGTGEGRGPAADRAPTEAAAPDRGSSSSQSSAQVRMRSWPGKTRRSTQSTTVPCTACSPWEHTCALAAELWRPAPSRSQVKSYPRQGINRFRTEDGLTPPSLPDPSCLGGNWQGDPEAAVSLVHRTEAEASRAGGEERWMWWAGAERGIVQHGMAAG